jgi:acyl carrier protein
MNELGPEDHPDLREALKRCSPATYYAACKFRQSGAVEHLDAVILGVIERYVERDLRPKLQHQAESLSLREDLALDSLTMMEIVMVAEDVLPITISNEELTRLRTIGDVQRFFAAKARGETTAVVSNHVANSSWTAAEATASAAKLEIPAPSS